MKNEFLEVNQNSLFIYEHGYTDYDIELYGKLKKVLEDRPSGPTSGDIVEIWSNNGQCFYRNGHIEKSSYHKTGLTYCEQPYIPFVNNDGTGIQASGGAWGEFPKKFKYVGKREKLFKVWGHCGACGNGAFNIKATVNVWKIVIDREYISHVVYTRKDSDFGYKYFIQKWDAKTGRDTAFRTMSGLKRYLRDRNLTMGGHIHGKGSYHKVIGDYDEKMYMDYKQFVKDKGDSKTFPILSNGDYTEAFFKDGVVYYCNPNVKERKKYTYFYE